MGLRGKQPTQPPHPKRSKCLRTTFVPELRLTEECTPLNYECHFLIKTMNFTEMGGENKHTPLVTQKHLLPTLKKRRLGKT